MAAPSRVAGTLFLSVDGVMRSPRGSLEIQPMDKKRTSITNLDGTVSFKEEPIAPYIKAELEVNFNPRLLQNMQGATVVAQVATGQSYILTGAFLEGEVSYDPTEGKASFQFTGSTMTVA